MYLENNDFLTRERNRIKMDLDKTAKQLNTITTILKKEQKEHQVSKNQLQKLIKKLQAELEEEIDGNEFHFDQIQIKNAIIADTRKQSAETVKNLSDELVDKIEWAEFLFDHNEIQDEKIEQLDSKVQGLKQQNDDLRICNEFLLKRLDTKDMTENV